MDHETALVASRCLDMQRFPGRTIQSILKQPYSFNSPLSGRGLSVITQHIILGGRDEVSNNSLLKSYGVTHILNVAQQLPNYHSESDFIYSKVPLLDDAKTNITEHMGEISDFLSHVESIGGRVVVHCISGVSRSVAVILMHLILAHYVPLLTAHRYIKSGRPFIDPNEGFKLQCAELEVKTLGYSSVVVGAGKEWDFYQLNLIKGQFPVKDFSAKSCCGIS